MWIKVTEPKKCTVVRHKILLMSKEQLKRNVRVLVMHICFTETAIIGNKQTALVNFHIFKT